ncbi:hypothetical protein Sya03_16200 [Spirilliplanes yamanashiensis]|uniref:Peptidase S8/S53 domain-containing protein n=1 Tax=Spirilliplanes yamanashiensis TaxID=42233 RepID=A0A8J3Y5Q7_9ACTN|nr:hypothetical protein Sya03_16200 [Spirilliplanes yamanashiensis]
MAPVPAGAPAGGSAAGPLTAPPLSGDPVRDEQWQLKALDIDAAWKLSTGAGVTVAVIDSGVDGGHADLKGQVLAGLDLVADSGDGRTDPVGHGTTVAALIAGRADDDAGVVGIAPKAKILPVRVLDKENKYDDALIVAKAVRWAVDSGAQVINLSLGGTGSSASLAAALDYAFAKDVVVVACTGNSGSTEPSEVWYPAREPGVIAVAGLERDRDALWSGSISGRQTVVSAPATQLVGARPGPSDYWRVQGTSFAAPMVSATAALIRARWPQMSAADVVNRIITSAQDMGPAGRDESFGYGMVDPVAALTTQVATVRQNPLDTTPSPGVARFGAAPGTGTDTAAGRPAGGNAPGSGTAWRPVATRAAAEDESEGGMWWGAATLFVVSAAAAAFTVRRVGRLG